MHQSVQTLDPPLNQTTLQASFEKACVWDINSGPAKKIMQLIGEMMVLDNQPFLMVEDLSFQRLMKHMAPSYPLPSRFHFCNTVIPNLLERAKKAITDNLNVDESNRSISFTTDICTCQHTNHSYIISCHSYIIPCHSCSCSATAFSEQIAKNLLVFAQ